MTNIVGVKRKSVFADLIEEVPFRVTIYYMPLIGVFSDLMKLHYRKLTMYQCSEINELIDKNKNQEIYSNIQDEFASLMKWLNLKQKNFSIAYFTNNEMKADRLAFCAFSQTGFRQAIVVEIF